MKAGEVIELIREHPWWALFALMALLSGIKDIVHEFTH